MVGQYLWGTLKVHFLMEELMRTQFFHHPEVSLHINLYLFENKAPRAELKAVRKNMEAQRKLVDQLEKTAKELRLSVDYLTEKTNR